MDSRRQVIILIGLTTTYAPEAHMQHTQVFSRTRRLQVEHPFLMKSCLERNPRTIHLVKRCRATTDIEQQQILGRIVMVS
jgi:hypothetical protein